MEMFADLINDLELIDLPLSNQLFTWSNLQSIPSLAKLDRFLVSTEWDLLFPLSKVTALPRVTSDHSPLRLETKMKLRTNLFRFERVWLTRDDLAWRMPIWWNEISGKSSNVLTMVSKLGHCRKRLKEWCATNFYNILHTKKCIADKILKLDQLEEGQNLTPPQREIVSS